MKDLIYIFSIVTILMVLGGITISIRPFSISLTRGWVFLGSILMICGLVCLKIQWYKEGVKRGAEITNEAVKEIIDEKLKEKI